MVQGWTLRWLFNILAIVITAILTYYHDYYGSFTDFKAKFQGFGQAALYALFYHQAINNRTDVMLFIFLQLYFLI
jgi:hypothetical protein